MKNIIWAIDDHTGERALQEQCLPAIKMVAPGAKIQPVSVLSPLHLIKYNSGIADVMLDVEAAVKKKLSDWIGSFNEDTLQAPTVLLEDRYSITKSVKRLLSHAEEKKADMIVASTHARKGLKRVSLGSFAESLVTLSKVPVLIVNPRARIATKLNQILVPTDLGDASKKAFNVAVEIAKGQNAKIRLFHQVEFMTGLSAPTFNFSPLYAKYLKEDVDHRYEIGKEWTENAAKAGVTAEFVLSERGQYPGEGIVHEGKSCDLTVMAAQSGPVSSFFLGSVTRNVIRETEEPVLVVHQ